jgi:hypothetical protein
MKAHRLMLAGVVLLSAIALSRAQDVKKAEPPKTEPPAAPAVKLKLIIDTSEVPDLKEWGDSAGKLVEKWYPVICYRLKSDGFTPPAEITIVFKKEMKGIAFTTGRRVQVAGDWVRKHPQDWGMIIHEVTHAVQSYKRASAGWAVAGIADYIRYHVFEPGGRPPRIDAKKSSYKEGYKTAAAFLAWIESKHDKAIIAKLNRALREGKYDDRLFEDSTGKTLDDLWREFVGGSREKTDKAS